MQKLILLVTILLVSLIASSQTVTKTITSDSVIVLPKLVGRAVVKDIIRKDSLESELVFINKNYALLEANLVAKDSIIASKDNMLMLWDLKDKNYNSIIALRELQKTNLETLNKSLAKDLRKTKRTLAATKIGGGVLIAGVLYLLVK